MTPNPITAAVISFRLPPNGERDPWFGLAHTDWSEAIRTGKVKSWLHRQRVSDRGGVRLIEYASARAFVEELRARFERQETKELQPR